MIIALHNFCTIYNRDNNCKISSTVIEQKVNEHVIHYKEARCDNKASILYTVVLVPDHMRVEVLSERMAV